MTDDSVVHAGGYQPLVPRPWTRTDAWILASVLFAALAIRMAFFICLRAQPWYAHPMVDSEVYHHWAQAIAAGDWLGRDIFNQSPLYPYLLGLGYSLTGPRPGLAIFLQLILSAMNCGLLALVGRRLISPRAGWIAGGLEACYAPSFFLAGSLLTSALIETLNLGALLATLWALERRSWRAWCLPGALFGLSFITRPNVILLLLGMAGWLWLVWKGKGKRRWQNLLALAICAALVVAPVTARNRLVLKEFVLSVPTGALNFFLGNVPNAFEQAVPVGEAGLIPAKFAQEFKARAEQRLGKTLTFSESNHFWLGLAWDAIRRAPAAWARVLGYKTALFVNAYEDATSLNYYVARESMGFLRLPWLSAGVVLPLGLLGLGLAWPQRRRLAPLYLWVAAYAASNILLFVTLEYRYAVLPPFFLFAAVSLIRLGELAQQKNWRPGFAALLVLGLLAVCVNFPLTTKEQKNRDLAYGHGNLAGLYERQGDYAGALKEYALIKKLITPEKNLNFYVTVVFKEMQMRLVTNQPGVLADIQSVLPYIQNQPPLLDKFGQALEKIEIYDLAIPAFLRATWLAPNEAQYFYHLGQAYLETGQDSQATEALQRAAALDPRLAQDLPRARRKP